MTTKVKIKSTDLFDFKLRMHDLQHMLNEDKNKDVTAWFYLV